MHTNCERCLKPGKLCVCAAVVEVPTSCQVLILQHPQEPDKLLGTAHIAHMALKNSQLRVGLSWPNIEAALKHKTERAKWAVLYLGSAKKTPATPRSDSQIYTCSKRGKLSALEGSSAIGGLIVLDGTWSQAKALWWRNAWLNKLRRLVLVPQAPSIYGNLRREPRKEALSTIESLAYVLSELEGRPDITEMLLSPFKELVRLYGNR